MNSLEIGKQMIMPESVKALGSVVMFWNPPGYVVGVARLMAYQREHPEQTGVRKLPDEQSGLSKELLEKVTGLYGAVVAHMGTGYPEVDNMIILAALRKGVEPKDIKSLQAIHDEVIRTSDAQFALRGGHSGI
ncbi:MAG: hypothetical protein NTY06_03000 [Candidatus Gottesmanbacteria bacterium]|nr:hypothetical protein [Candidatus Gottesmanbacteria bacterium]